ncbi:ABC transporter substrate-binding protein [Amycolatopsis japonica]|uniref:ABC transporter substrate-binding protein n=1 Tax=Amycolatopsis TaxID=1813 RepID=UPI00131597D0|nr:ABC transporter substrate-binding protein [Amycolatopsis sp. WAC 04197]
MPSSLALRIVAIGGGLLLLAAACAGPGATESADAGPPVAGGTLTYALDAEPDCLDPHASPQDITAMINRGVLDSLIAEDANGGLHPWLADSWTVGADGHSVTFQLRTGVSFHDGTPFDAAAVKANFDHIAAPATRSYYAASLLGRYAGTDVLGPLAARVRFDGPVGGFLQAASQTFLGMQSPKAISEAPEKLCAKPVGSGPFVFEAHQRQQSIELRKNPGYTWGPAIEGHTGPAFLDRLVFRFLPDDSVRLGALTSGQVDAITNVPPVRSSVVRDNRALRLTTLDQPGMAYNLHLNVTRPPFDDERVRIAFQRVLDLDGIVSGVYFGQNKRAWSPLSPSTPGYDRETEGRWRFDPALANRLLDEAGWTGRDPDGNRVKDGTPLRVMWPLGQLGQREQRDILGQGIQAEAKKAGFDVVRVPSPPGQYTAQRISGDYDINAMSWNRHDGAILRSSFGADALPPGGQNYARITDPGLDATVKSSLFATDDAARNRSYTDIQKFVVDHAVIVPVYVPSYVVAAETTVHGIVSDAQAYPRFHKTWVSR